MPIKFDTKERNMQNKEWMNHNNKNNNNLKRILNEQLINMVRNKRKETYNKKWSILVI